MNTLTRRDFITTTVIGATTLGSGLTARGQSSEAPFKLGLIGCGGYGRTDLRKAWQAGGVDLVAICDVDSAHLQQIADEAEKQQGHRPKMFKHYTDLLALPDLDLLILATPAHWHALPFIAACEKGLAIYCEKPLAYDVRESRAMVQAAQKHGNLVQIGFQRRSSENFKQVREFIQGGGAGRIICVDAQINWNLGMGDPTPVAPPDTLDWEWWCGPSPLLPYSQQIGHRLWRYEKNTGNGHLVDWGIHLVDVTRWILGAGSPTSVTATGAITALKDIITTPDVMSAQFMFGDVPVTWKHRIWGAAEAETDTAYATTFFGDKATVLVTEKRWVVIPRERGAERIVHDVPCDAQLAHMEDFLDAVRHRRQPACTIEDAHHSTTAVNLAMLAYEWGGELDWDIASEEVLNNPDAAAHVIRPYRQPWKHPFPYQG